MLSADTQTISKLISGQERDLDLDSFSPADWDTLARKAYAEGVGPLLYWRISKIENVSSLPDETRSFLRILYAGTHLQNQVLFKELEQLASDLHQAGIPAVVLKGACLALTVYPDLGLRPMGDVDVLVPTPKLDEAVGIAKSLGFVDAAPEASSGLHELLSHHVSLQKAGSQAVIVEIHDRLAGEDAFSFAVPVGWFWEQAEPLDNSSLMQFQSLLMLSPVAQILYAAGHAMLQHGGENAPLRWFYDLDLLIRHYHERMDWDLLLSQAKTFEWGSALAAALFRTVTYFNTPVPKTVLAALAQATDRHRELVALKQSRSETHILLERQKLLSLNLYGRIRLILALLVPNPAYMRHRYHLKSSWMLLFYYPFRWWLILKDALRTLIVIVRNLYVPSQ